MQMLVPPRNSSVTDVEEALQFPGIALANADSHEELLHIVNARRRITETYRQ